MRPCRRSVRARVPRRRGTQGDGDCARNAPAAHQMAGPPCHADRRQRPARPQRRCRGKKGHGAWRGRPGDWRAGAPSVYDTTGRQKRKERNRMKRQRGDGKGDAATNASLPQGDHQRWRDKS